MCEICDEPAGLWSWLVSQESNDPSDTVELGPFLDNDPCALAKSALISGLRRTSAAGSGPLAELGLSGVSEKSI